MSSSYHMRPEQAAQNEDLLLTNSQGGASAPTTRPYAAVIPLIEADEERCHYCSKALAEYPLIQSDEAAQTVYHAACAVELATDILVDLFTFLSPPAPYERLFVLTTPDATPSQQTSLERE